MKSFILLLSSVSLALTQMPKEDVKFPENTPIIMLDEDSWDSMTKLGRNQAFNKLHLGSSPV